MLCYPTHYIRSISKKKGDFPRKYSHFENFPSSTPILTFFPDNTPNSKIIKTIPPPLTLLPRHPLSPPLPLPVFHPPPLPFFPTTHPLLLHPQIGSGSGGRGGGNGGGGRGAVWIVFEL